jgi:hypothetical protein
MRVVICRPAHTSGAGVYPSGNPSHADAAFQGSLRVAADGRRNGFRQRASRCRVPDCPGPSRVHRGRAPPRRQSSVWRAISGSHASFRGWAGAATAGHLQTRNGFPAPSPSADCRTRSTSDCRPVAPQHAASISARRTNQHLHTPHRGSHLQHNGPAREQ